ncbi:MAG: hypothetical protein ACRCUT_09485, partial [Spirochaetota bacterium]
VSAGKGDAACMIFPDAGQLTSLTAVSGNGYYAGPIESPVLGSVDFLVRGDCSMCSVILSGSASVCEELRLGESEFISSLLSRYPSASVLIADSDEIREKVLALVPSLSHNALDVIA